jgi:hypothetical protein
MKWQAPFRPFSAIYLRHLSGELVSYGFRVAIIHLVRRFRVQPLGCDGHAKACTLNAWLARTLVAQLVTEVVG